MFAIEFRLKISSMYSIRVPYSYQCARTYPLPAPSTIKGLCANALWRKEGDELPDKILETIDNVSLGATSRADHAIAVSSCTVNNLMWDGQLRKFKTNALLRQFAFTPYIDCMIVLEDDKLGGRIREALKVTPVYLGDSESLVCVIPDSVKSHMQPREVKAGDAVEINSLLKFDFVKDNAINEKGVVLYMQDDPCSLDAVLDRYIAPLKQQGDSYSPIKSLSFTVSKNCFIFEGLRLKGIFCGTQKEEPPKQKTKRPTKKKA